MEGQDESEGEPAVHGVLLRVEDDAIVLQVPHTDYALRLRLAEGVAPPGEVGKRIRGVIDAKALRIHATAGGGRFIEPIIGEPRIIAGAVLTVDEPARRVLVDAAIPMWLHTTPDQDFSIFRSGGLVNGHVQSGATFTPQTG